MSTKSISDDSQTAARHNVQSDPQYSDLQLQQAASLLGIPVEVLRERLGVQIPVEAQEPTFDDPLSHSEPAQSGKEGHSQRTDRALARDADSAGFEWALSSEQFPSHQFEYDFLRSSLSDDIPLHLTSSRSYSTQFVACIPPTAPNIISSGYVEEVGEAANEDHQHQLVPTPELDTPYTVFNDGKDVCSSLVDHSQGAQKLLNNRGLNFAINGSVREPGAFSAIVSGTSSLSEEVSTDTSSSWVITTPPSHNDQSRPRSSSPSRISDNALSVIPEEAETYFQTAAFLGPCSNTWEIPRIKTRSEKQTQSPDTKRKRTRGDTCSDGPRRRGAFTDQQKRERTAWTRILRSCIRCRMQRVRCDPDLNEPYGPCLTCQRVSDPRLCKLPCLRYIITDSSLYREQSAPYQLFSKRWQNMDLIDITEWASNETKTIEISQIFLDAPYPVEVKEFIPVQGDMLEEQWTSGTVVKSHRIPRYALADMEGTAKMLLEFIERNIGTYIAGAVGNSDGLLWQTYMMAFKHAREATSLEERLLLLNCFRLWVACRKTSNPHHIYGEDKLGGETVDDPVSPFFNRVPMPVIMIAQMECIMYTKVLRPMSKKVLDDLQTLVLANKRKHWLTIYLTVFILLHSCAMITRRDEETARQYNLQERFANPNSIKAHHSGAQTMLAHFHYINKGVQPFSLALSSSGIMELAEAAELNAEQVEFARDTAIWVKERAALMENIKERRAFGNDFYWIAQLYDEGWKPGPTA